MTKQRVFRLPLRTAIEDLQITEADVPEPAAQEVLIRVKNVALNYRDFVIAIGVYPFPVKENVIPGSDMYGEVVQVGSQVDDFATGDRVIASFDLKTLYGPVTQWTHHLGGSHDGVLREYIALPRSALVKVPSGSELSGAQLSSLVCTGATVWNAFYGNTPLLPGHVVLFLGKNCVFYLS